MRQKCRRRWKKNVSDNFDRVASSKEVVGKYIVAVEVALYEGGGGGAKGGTCHEVTIVNF